MPTFAISGIMLQWTWGRGYLFKIQISFPLDIHPEVELLDLMVVLFLIFFGKLHAVPIVAAPVYIPTNGEQWFRFLHIFTNICYLLLFFL